MKQFKNQQGAMVLEIGLVIITLAALGFAFYTVSKTRSEVAKQTQSTSAQPKVQVKQPASNKLAVKELGVQLTIPAGLEGLSYKYVAPGGEHGNSFPIVQLISKQLSNQKSSCEGYDAQIGSFTEAATQPTDADGHPYPANMVRHIGGYYYTLSLPNGGPCFDSEPLATTERQQRGLVEQAFQTLESTK